MEKNKSLLRGMLFVLSIFILTKLFRLVVTLIYFTTSSYALMHALENTLFLTTLMHITVLIIPCLFYIHKCIPKGEVKKTLRLNMFTFRNLLYIIFIIMFFTPIVALISYITTLFYDNVASDLILQAIDLPMYVVLLVLAVMPAISEELIFRGILLSNFDDSHNFLYAMLNGFLFGILHGNASQFFYAFAIGILFYYIVKISNSLYLASIAHFMINSQSVILSYFVDVDQTVVEDAVEYSDLEVIQSLGVVCLVSGFIFFLIFRSFVKYNNKLKRSSNYANKEIDLAIASKTTNDTNIYDNFN